MGCFRPFAIGSVALTAVLLAQQPDPYPGGGPPTSGTPGTRPGQVPQGGSGIPRSPLGGKKKRSQAKKPELTVPTDSASGLLVKVGAEKLVILAADNRVIRYVISPAATFFRMEG